MVGGGNRRDEGSWVINNTNVFAALEREKKKSDKDRGSLKSKGSSKSQAKEPKPQVFWAPTPLTTKSWADVDDDDDYYATTAPPPSVWNLSESDQTKERQAPVEESESEEDILDEGDEEVEEDHDQEPEEPIQAEPMVNNVPEVSSAPTERQLSKKERKKKELAELEALLADFGVSPKVDSTQDESHDVTKETKDGEAIEIGACEKKENVPTESKGAKKKKKKDKSSKEVKESQDQPKGPEDNAGAEQAEEDASGIDVKERLKKMASVKKKKSNKELDTAARAAAIEAAARSARLAVAKKKEKNHYNQQPIR